MKFRHGDRVHDLVRRKDDLFAVDGVEVTARVTPIGGARFEGEAGERRAAVFVVRESDRVLAQVGGRSYDLRVVSRPAGSPAAHASGEGGLEAPMPGRVTRVNVAVGDSVRKGQELIVVEAMKMENALNAPVDGMVKSLAVAVGDMVAPGPVLVVIEARS